MVWLAAAAFLAVSDLTAPERLAVSGELDAPPGAVVRLFADVEKYPQIFSAIKRAEVRSRTGNRSVAFVEVAFPWPIGPKWLLAETNTAQDRVTWRRLEGSVRQYEGSLQLTELPGGRSRASFDAVLDTGWSGTPGWLTSWMQGRVLAGILSDTKRYVRNHAKIGAGDR